MKSIRFLAFGLALLVFCISNESAKASHAMGADLSYRCLGNNQYLVRLVLYRDCSGISMTTTGVSIDINSVDCNVSNLSFPLTFIPPQAGQTNELDSLYCSSATTNCSGGTNAGVERYIFEGTITLPSQCDDWTLSYDLCCRNDAITNLLTPASENIYVQAVINNTTGLCNNSPQFTSPAIYSACVNQLVNYSHGGFDIDGDSLVFTCISPMGANAAPISNVSGLAPCNPLFVSDTFQLDPVTGQMSFTPDRQQFAVITVRVDEYRNDTLIGSTMRDLQVVVRACTNTSPTAPDTANVSGGVSLDPFTFQVCPGENLTFQIISSDPDTTDVLIMNSNVAQAIPNATFTTVSLGNIIRGTFSWTPGGNDNGTYVFTVTITDDKCPVPGVVTFSYRILVLRGTSAGPDRFYCPTGGPVQLNVQGGNVFTWDPIPGLSCYNCPNPTAAPNVTTAYYVTSDLASVCKNRDTVVVNLVPDFPLTLSPQDTICKNSSTTITATADPAFGPYTYRWTPSNTLINSNTPSPIAVPEVTTDYVVEVTASTGCVIRDTLKLVVEGIGPIVEISADKNNVCPGDTVQLETLVFPLDCGPTVNGCSAQNPPSPRTFGATNAASFNGTPFFGSQEDSRFQALYLAPDLLAAGLRAGTITRIQFEVASKASNNPYRNLTVKLGCTTADNLTVAGNWEDASTIVYGPSNFSTTIGTISFALSTPYDWDGRSNLVLEICYNNPGLLAPGGDDWLMFTPVGYNATMRVSSNGATGCTLSPQFVNQQIPKTIFSLCEPLASNFTYEWQPALAVSNDSILNPTAIVTGQHTLTLFVRDSVCEGSGNITLTIDTSYEVVATPDTVLCNLQPVQLNVSVLGTPPLTPLSCGANGTQCINAPVQRQVGSNTTTTTVATPFRGVWENSRTQLLYKAADLIAAGMPRAGTITELAFNVTSKLSSIPYTGYTVKIACTNLNTLPTSFVTANFTTVYGPIAYSTVVGWNTHVLTNPYDWDGLSNLIIEICYNNPPNVFTSNDAVQYTSTTGSTLYQFSSTTPGCVLSTGSPTSSSLRANIRFTFCEAPVGTQSIAWCADPTLSSTTIPNPIANPTSTTTYCVDYTFINGCTRRDSVTVVVDIFSGSATGDTSVCPGGSAQLTATGGIGAIFSWDNIPGLSCYNCPNPIASPDTTTDYFVSITGPGGGCLVRDTVRVEVFPSPVIQFANDSLYCFQTSFTLNAGPGFASYLWSTTDTTASIEVTTADVYSVTVVDPFGCVASDSVELVINPAPDIDLGADTVLCAGDSLTLSAGSFPFYTWNTNATDSEIVVFSSGNYAVTVADTNNCPASDTISVIFSSPNVDLGSNDTLCQGESLVLIAGNSLNNYLWSDFSNDTFLVVAQAGIYSVTASDTAGCVDIDTVSISFSQTPPVDLGPDRTTCNGKSVLLDAGAGYIIYSWAHGATTPNPIVSLIQTYSVTVTDSSGCVSSDSLELIDNTPVVNISNDATICEGESQTFTASGNFLSYVWNNNATTASITVTNDSVYSVTATDANGCTATGSVRLTVNDLPTPDLGDDDSTCQHILFPEPGGFVSYQWTDTSTDSTFIVTQSGTHCVTVTDANGCTASDCATIILITEPVNITGTVLCSEGDSAVLAAPADLDSYLWSNGETTASITVTAPGIYSITVQNDGCSSMDTAEVVNGQLQLNAFADPESVGPDGNTTLNVEVTGGSGSYDYLWIPAVPDSNAQNPVVSPNENSTYIVQVIDNETECVGFDTVQIIMESAFAFPSAFNPNGTSAQNRVFKLIPRGSVEVIEFRIYNRWGELVSSDVNGWDGTYEGKEQPIGTYTYYGMIQKADGTRQPVKGVFSLVR